MAKTGKLLPAYLVMGSNEVKRDETLSRIKARLDPGLAAFNLDEIEADGATDPEVLRMSLNGMPMGDAFRLVIVHGADKLSKDVLAMLSGYLDDPNPTTVLMLVCGDLPKTSKFLKCAAYKKISKLGKTAIIDCTPEKAWKLPDFLVKNVADKKFHIRLDRNAAEELVKRSGTSMQLLQNEIQQLSQFAAEPGHIKLSDVRAHITRTAEVTPWEFADAVSKRDAKEALSLLWQMHLDSYLGILSYLTDRIRELICARCLDARGDGARLADELHKQSWQVRNHIQWSRRFTEAELVHDLAVCARCDRALKSGADADTAMVEAIVEICQGRTGFLAEP